MSSGTYWLAELLVSPFSGAYHWLVAPAGPEPLNFSLLIEAQQASAAGLAESSVGAAVADHPGPEQAPLVSSSLSLTSGPEQAPLVPLSLTLTSRPTLTFVDLEPSFVRQLLEAKQVATLARLCPSFLNPYLHRAELTTDPGWSPAARATRAFRAGVSAARVVAGAFHKQAASLRLRGDNYHYIVLRCRQLPGGFYTQAYSVYTTYLVTAGGSLQRGSVSHAFESAIEVEIFLRGAHRQWPVELRPGS